MSSYFKLQNDHQYYGLYVVTCCMYNRDGSSDNIKTPPSFPPCSTKNKTNSLQSIAVEIFERLNCSYLLTINGYKGLDLLSGKIVSLLI